MLRTISLTLLIALGSGFCFVAWSEAQTTESIELRQKSSAPRLGFGLIGVVETTSGLNRDRPEVSSMIALSPQLKIGPKMRVRLNTAFIVSWLDRQENPWDFTDVSLQFSHLGFFEEKHTGLVFSGYGRYYFPTSKYSRDAGSFGQLRGVGTVSRSFGPVHLSFDFNAQKYFHRYTTWSTEENPGSDEWLHSAGRDDYIENNISFGFGETLTGTATVVPGLDLSASFALYQSRPYQPKTTTNDAWGSSYLQIPRDTTWSHSFRFVADVTYRLGAMPWIERSRLKESLLSKTYLSLGYFCLAPQLQNGGSERSLNPFNPKYAQAYLDVMVMY